jgi:hypothetical protein
LIEVSKPILKSQFANLHNYIHRKVIPGIIHSQHALAWLKFVKQKILYTFFLVSPKFEYAIGV